MNNRPTRAPMRAPQPQMVRGPQSHHLAQPQPVAYSPAPHAALLIDFDNVTMGIRSDLAVELKTLLSSSIVQGKIAIQRAYADWRRYPQYVLPLTESSIDLIYAPAYGSARKNATDIRLAIDAMELVFTRPEIGTIILLSGDSDFSSLVIKLKEYGKYVIGVGIRESSSDLLVQNCDEYYSYNALAGLTKTSDEVAAKWDPWELAGEAVVRMKRNGDVMRSDRLKQVMQEIDSSFDEKDLGHPKFSRFVGEAAQRGLLTMTKLDNGQLEVDLPASTQAGLQVETDASASTRGDAPAGAAKSAAPSAGRPPRDEDAPRSSRGGRGRRGRRGGRDSSSSAAPLSSAAPSAAASAPAAKADAPGSAAAPAAAASAGATSPAAKDAPPSAGTRLTRTEAHDLIRRAVDALIPAGGDSTVSATEVRAKARELLGRDSDTLAERHFQRILQDAHDADMIDLRRRGDDFDVARSSKGPSVADQLRAAAPAPAAASAAAGARPAARAGRSGFGKRLGEAPANLLSVGVVGSPSTSGGAGAGASAGASAPAAAPAPPPAEKDSEADAKAATAKKKPARKSRARKSATADAAGDQPAAAAKKPAKKRAAKKAGTGKPAARKRAKAKSAGATSDS